MRITVDVKKKLQISLLSLLPMVVACSTAIKPSPTYPANLTVIELSDGGVCLDATSALRLADFKAELEAW